MYTRDHKIIWFIDSLDSLSSPLYYVKKTKRFVISSSNKSSEHNLSYFFGIKKPSRKENVQSQ